MSPDMPLAARIRASLAHASVIALATIVRSILFERWSTVLASLLLLIGIGAAWRTRTWGLGVALAAATAFPVAHLLGIGPGWFWFVGVAGALPFFVSWRPMAFFDRRAAVLYAALAVGAGTAGAFACSALS
jgi:hypothetical protein